MFAAEGSDWFWWFGNDQESHNDAAFDELFRTHLKAVYAALELEAPDALDAFIVAHPVVWTFTHPLAAIRRTDQLTIRTNCPGRLTKHRPTAALGIQAPMPRQFQPCRNQ